ARRASRVCPSRGRGFRGVPARRMPELRRPARDEPARGRAGRRGLLGGRRRPSARQAWPSLVRLTIGSLFAGIGGLELGLEMAGLGPVVWQVETDAACRDVLAMHWPKAERFHDVRAVDASALAPVDIVCGGFPCQDLSHAGKGKGLAGERSGLWFEFERIVQELGP